MKKLVKEAGMVTIRSFVYTGLRCAVRSSRCGGKYFKHSALRGYMFEAGIRELERDLDQEGIHINLEDQITHATAQEPSMPWSAAIET